MWRRDRSLKRLTKNCRSPFTVQTNAERSDNLNHSVKVCDKTPKILPTEVAVVKRPSRQISPLTRDLQTPPRRDEQAHHNCLELTCIHLVEP